MKNSLYISRICVVRGGRYDGAIGGIISIMPDYEENRVAVVEVMGTKKDNDRIKIGERIEAPLSSVKIIQLKQTGKH
jgi:hypothetical protein